jgi:predicted NUDIX family phosphoesterase
MSVSSAEAPCLRLILAARAEGLPSELADTQFRPMVESEAIRAFEEAGIWLGPRAVLEHTEDYRQIIPYIVLQHGSRFIRYTRMPSGGENRLHGRTSIGVGGHVDLGDIMTTGESIDLFGTLSRAAEREVSEELGAVECKEKTWVGVLVENDTAVGRVHIGLVGLWQLSALPSGVAEEALGEVAHCSIEELKADCERLETWSCMVLEWLAKSEGARLSVPHAA